MPCASIFRDCTTPPPDRQLWRTTPAATPTLPPASRPSSIAPRTARKRQPATRRSLATPSGFGGSPNQNVADGYQALYSSTDGFENVATGYRALYNSTQGDQNTAVGYQALLGNSTGGNNIALGQNAGSLLTTGSGNIDIGHPGVAGESNIIRIGDGATQTDIYLTGIIHGTGSALTGIPASSLTGTASEISLPATESSGTGVLNIGGSPFLSAYGPDGLSDGQRLCRQRRGQFHHDRLLQYGRRRRGALFQHDRL
jgi:hypothetical protein